MTDKDKDGYITYPEYFGFINKYICQTETQFEDYQKSPLKKPKNIPEPVVEKEREWNSRIRIYIWLQLKKLYEAYVVGRCLPVDDNHLKGLILSILGDLSSVEMTFLLTGLYKLASKNIEFIPFAIIFIYLVAELGLSRFQKGHSNSKKSINFEEFYLIFKNTFMFLGVGRIRMQILQLIFIKIDSNNDGLISFEEYLEWIRKYLAVDINSGERYYIKEDDDALKGTGDIFEIEAPLAVLPDKPQRATSKVKFNFTNYDLAKLVRGTVWTMLIPFDANKDLHFD